MEAYLDNSATTKCVEEAKDIFVKLLIEDFGNPSSMHLKGVKAEQYIKEAKEKIARNLKVNEKEIYFTSGGTESNNMAIIGAAIANKRAGMHIITTEIEHPSVSNTMEFLESQGFKVTYIPVNENGIVSTQALEEAICDETILVSTMYINNEIGSVQPIDKIAQIIKNKKPDVIYHVDAIQAYGKYKISPKKEGIDMLSVSGHKIHAPKGVGILYVNEKIKIKPIIYGGGQQKGLRSGTENAAGCAAIAVAIEKTYENLNEKVDRLYDIKKLFIEGINSIEGTKINGLTDRKSAPHIVSVSFKDVRSEVLLHSLEDKGVYVSAGSACAAKKTSVSKTLKAIKLPKDLLDSTIRFSFSFETTQEEIEYCLECLREALPKLRMFTRR